jgi:hypothetical protein
MRVINGVNSRLNPFEANPQDFIQGDPELSLERAGEILEPEMLSTAYYNSAEPDPRPVADFKLVDVIYDAQGQEKEHRPHLIRPSNLNDPLPIKIGKRIPIQQAFTSFVFKYTYQIVHEDGVTLDFLYGLAKELGDRQELALVGAGTKGNQPLVVREKGSPYRGFLYGEVGTGENEGQYKLLLLLSEQELKLPAI